MANLPSWYDSWKTLDETLESPDEEICSICGETMEFREDVDVDEETGRAYLCGGGWHCCNKDCGKDEKPTEKS